VPGRSHRRSEARDADRGRSDQPGRSGTRVISSRSLLALLGGELVSRLGSQLTYLALPWFVLVTTGSPTRMGLVFAVQLAPMALLGIPAGSVVQRLGPKRSMLVADAARAPIVALVPFLNAVGGLTFPLILVVAALLGAFSCAYFTCQRLILPAVVGEDEQRLAQANSLVEGTTNVTNLLGPALAGILIALMGAANVMWLDALSFALAFVLIGLFVDAGHDVNGEDGDAGGVWAGLAYLRRDLLVARVSLSSLTFGFLFPMLAASLPVLAFEQYDHNPRVAGLLFAVIGGGQVVGSVLAFRFVTRMPGMRLAAIAAFFTAAPLWLLVPHASLAVVGGALAICGASVPIINAPYLGMLSVRVPRSLRGKVLQSLITINQLAGPIGYVVAGTLFVAIGLHGTYALIAFLATLASLNFILAAPRFSVVQEAA
jgi:MFS family permease